MATQQENAAHNQQNEELRLAEADDGELPQCTTGMPLSMLVDVGVDARDIEKLVAGGLPSVQSVAFASTRELDAIKGLSAAKAQKVKNEARKMAPLKFQSAVAYAEELGSRLMITTGSKQVDDLLAGGFESGSISELYGESRSGKTQICHMLAVTAQLGVAEGGGEGKCLYIDTEGTFRPQRIAQIATRFELEPEDVLTNIAYARAHNVEHQLELLNEATRMMTESRFSVVIVDSATALYRSEYRGRGELSERQTHLCGFLRGLQRIADNFGVAVVLTNQVVATVDGGPGMSFGPQLKAIGGNIMAHSTTTRLWVKRGKASTRVVKVMASPCLPESDAQFSIADQGVMDADVA